MPVCEPCLAAPEAIADDDFCRGCGRAAPAAGELCLECQAALPAYNGARSVAHYRGAARELVHLLKYEGVRTVAAWMADALAARWAAWPVAADRIVAVPLSGGRRRERGFNQSEAIGAALARRTGWRLETRGLERRRATAPQAGLSAAERRANVRGAFRARAERVAGRHVLLLDDVLTTGATADACAAALKQAGAAAVSVLTYARAELRAGAAAPAAGARP